MNTENLLEVIEGLAPRIPWSTINSALGMTETAEDEITRAQTRHPRHSKRIWNSFGLLCPNVYIRGVPEPVYRAHCAEILDRVAQGLDTTLGTRAEIMMGLSAASLKSPLTHTAAVLCAQLFRDILKDSPVSDDPELELLSTMAFDQTTGTLLAELSKKCRDPERKLGPAKGE